MRRGSRKADYLLSIVVFSLLILGIIMISSASVVISYDSFGSNNFYLIRHIISASIATAVFVVFYFINYKFWRRVSLLLIISAIILLFLVFLFGIQLGGARRWLDLGLFTIQPTEFAKLAFVLYLATWLESRQKNIKDFKHSFIPFVVMTGFIGVLIVLQPDFGTAGVILATAALMFIVAGASYEQIVFGGAAVAFLGWFLVRQSSHAFARLTVFLDPSADAQGIGYHINQALLAIGSGGILGLGFGMSRQKYHYLPEPMGDSIFAIIAEEMGFARMLFLIFLFFMLAYRGYRVAKNAPDVFSRLVAFGITSWLVIQSSINIAAMLSLVPLTGVPLPFISYGGSSLIVSMAGAGILLNISKHSKEGERYESSYRSGRNSRPHSPRNYRSRTSSQKRRRI